MFRTPVRCHVEHGWVRARCDSEAIPASRGRNMVRIAPSIDWATCRGKAVARAAGRVAGTDIDVRIKLAFLYSTLRMRLSTSVVRPTEVHGVSREVHPPPGAAAPAARRRGRYARCHRVTHHGVLSTAGRERLKGSRAQLDGLREFTEAGRELLMQRDGIFRRSPR